MTFLSQVKCFGCACAVALVGTAAPAQDLEQVDMAIAGGSLIATLPLIMDDLGLFEAQGLEPNFVMMDSSSATATALMSNSVSFAFSGPGSLVAAQARGQDLVVFNATYRGLGGTLVLTSAAAEASGVSPDATVEERLRALDGMNIAAPSATSTFTIAYRDAAAQFDAEPNFTYMAISNMPAALSSGAIDGYVASAPFWLVPVVDGSGVEWISGPAGELPAEFSPALTAVTLVMRDWAESNPEIISKVRTAFDQFDAALVERPDEVKAFIQERFPNVASDTVNRLYEAESPAWQAGQVTAEDIAQEVEFVVNSSSQVPATVRDIDPATMILN